MKTLESLLKSRSCWNATHYLLTALVFFLDLTPVLSASASPMKLEVFTTQDRPVTNRMQTQAMSPGSVTLEVYWIDALARVKATLSKKLPNDPDVAKAEALRRIEQLSQAHIDEVQRAAVGLSKATQYGLDRYPALVFNGEAVIYGVTDVGEALRHYQGWREMQAQ